MQFKKQDRRQIQVEKQIQESLASFLLKNLSVSRDGLISVTRVQVPKDLKTANVYVHQYGKTEEENEALIETLQKKLSLIQKHLTQELKLRFSPRIEFHYDEGFDKTLAVDKLIYDMTKSGAIKKEESSD